MYGTNGKEYSIQQFQQVYINDCTKHPSYQEFIKQLKLLDTRLARDLWNLLIQGVIKQTDLNQEAQNPVAVNEQFWNKYCQNEEYRRICQNIYQNLEDNKKQDYVRTVVKNSNEYYMEFADELAEYLVVESGKQLALWSGGRDLSDIAYNQYQKCPLEQTVLGHFLDKQPIVNEWKCEAPLWNIISRTFVKKYAEKAENKHAHVFMRTIENQSVLLRQEIPMLEGKVTIHWHCFVNNGKSLAEVGYVHQNNQFIPKLINIGEFENGYDKKDVAFQLLIQQLSHSSEKYNIRAIKQVFNVEYPEYKYPYGVNLK